MKRAIHPYCRMGLVVLLLVGFTSVSCEMQTQNPGEGNSVEIVQAFPNLSFERPVDFQHPGDGSGRVFVVEQKGVIQGIEPRRDVESANVFLDIQEKVRRQHNEEGLLGLAFHPRYEENGYFFVYYSASDPRRSIVARYEVDPNDPNRALPESEQVIMEIKQPYGNHNGGQIAFGPDGFLYIGLGDGGSGGDPKENGQDPSTLLGSILRIDVDSPSDGRAYGIPPDNPFVNNDQGYREEIYAYGLRNPWRFSWDSKTGTMWAGDVGQNEWEEINIIEKGTNCGWNIMEGRHCYEPKTGCDRSGLTLPIVEYSHEQGVSVTGGFVYRGSEVPALKGRYIYADYGSGRIWALTFDGKQAVENRLLADTDLAIASFGVDASQELYFTAFDGKIYTFRSPAGE